MNFIAVKRHTYIHIFINNINTKVRSRSIKDFNFKCPTDNDVVFFVYCVKVFFLYINLNVNIIQTKEI